MPAWKSHVLAMCFMNLLAAASYVQAASPSRDLALHDAIALTLAHNPALASFQPETAALQHEVSLKALPLPLSVEVQAENFAGTGATAGVKAIEATLQLSKVVELGGRPMLRQAVGSAQTQLLDATQRAKRADILAQTARRFVHVLADQARLESAKDIVQLAATTLADVERRLNAGAASPAALSRARIALARAEIEQEHAEHELASSRVLLSVMWNDIDANFGRAEGGLSELPTIEPLDRYRARLEDNPDLLRFANDARVLDARARLTDANARLSPTVTLGVRRLEALDEQAMVAGISIPLGNPRRAGLERQVLSAEREQLAHGENAKRLELGATLFALYQEMLHARTEAEALATRIGPQAEQMVSVTDEGYRMGRYSLIEVADAHRELMSIKQDAIRAAEEFHTNLIEIERLTGEPMHSLARKESP